MDHLQRLGIPDLRIPTMSPGNSGMKAPSIPT
jgi:hypothetical protein